jgi:hypothetical protein
MVTEGVEPSTVALLAQRSNQLSYATFLPTLTCRPTNTSADTNSISAHFAQPSRPRLTSSKSFARFGGAGNE